MRILGISAFYHDSAAALVVDGKVVAAAQEERFTRKKHDADFPVHSIQYCLQAGNTTLSEIDHIVFYDKPFLKFERLLETYLAFAPRGFPSFLQALPVWLKEKLFQKKLLVANFKKLAPKCNVREKLLFCEHHLSHSASAFYPSPFQEAAVLTMDGVGEWATTSAGVGSGSDLKILKEIHFPHSLGLLYSAFTYYTGFKVNSGEYKVMGLAPYGTPRYADLILNHLIDLKEDGSFRLNMKYFDYCVGLKMTNDKFSELFGGPPRKAETPLTQREMDLAASIQKVTEDVVLRLARSLCRETGQRNLCLAGGVALNCVANGKIVKEKICDQLWIQPAAGDAGGALGAALYAYYVMSGKSRSISGSLDGMNGTYLGPSFESSQIKAALDRIGARYVILQDHDLFEKVSEDLKQEKAIGWFQGRMEFGPRSLGARSILGDPRSPGMQKNLNLKVKFRESFRPFAPSVMREDLSEWFDLDMDSPYMMVVAPVRTDKCREAVGGDEKLFGIDRLNVVRSDIPAVTHIDYSARVQTVSKDVNPRFHRLLQTFKSKTGCPVLVNTSFNVRGEPIVCSPEDAFRCFMGTDIETLVIENFYLQKEVQNPNLRQQYENKFELD